MKYFQTLVFFLSLTYSVCSQSIDSLYGKTLQRLLVKEMKYKAYFGSQIKSGIVDTSTPYTLTNKIQADPIFFFKEDEIDISHYHSEVLSPGQLELLAVHLGDMIHRRFKKSFPEGSWVYIMVQIDCITIIRRSPKHYSLSGTYIFTLYLDTKTL